MISNRKNTFNNNRNAFGKPFFSLGGFAKRGSIFIPDGTYSDVAAFFTGCRHMN
jgi:hypothetical protein